MLDDTTKLYIEEKRKEDRNSDDQRYALKWVEHFGKWLIVGVGTAVLAAIMKLILI